MGRIEGRGIAWENEGNETTETGWIVAQFGATGRARVGIFHGAEVFNYFRFLFSNLQVRSPRRATDRDSVPSTLAVPSFLLAIVKEPRERGDTLARPLLQPEGAFPLRGGTLE